MLKTVLITGASHGIGKAIADQWVEQSHRLIVTAQSEGSGTTKSVMLRWIMLPYYDWI